MASLNILNQSQDGLLLSDDESLLDMKKIHAWISLESYWAPGRSFETVERAFAFSYPIGVYEGTNQVAVARIVSDAATFGWLCDVFVDSSVRGRGIGTWLAKATAEWAEKNHLKRVILATRDAHDVYGKAGFQVLTNPGGWMELDRRAQTPAAKS